MLMPMKIRVMTSRLLLQTRLQFLAMVMDSVIILSGYDGLGFRV